MMENKRMYTVRVCSVIWFMASVFTVYGQNNIQKETILSEAIKAHYGEYYEENMRVTMSEEPLNKKLTVVMLKSEYNNTTDDNASFLGKCLKSKGKELLMELANQADTTNHNFLWDENKVENIKTIKEATLLDIIEKRVIIDENFLRASPPLFFSHEEKEYAFIYLQYTHIGGYTSYVVIFQIENNILVSPCELFLGGS